LLSESRKKTNRINELFNRLNLQITQDTQILKLNNDGYLSIQEISDKLSCPEEILLNVLQKFKNETKTFQQPGGDSYILVKFETIQDWYKQASENAEKEEKNIEDYLYNKYIGIDFNGCIPLCAAKDFLEQKNVETKYLIKAVKDNELHITKYNGEEMIKEDDLAAWVIGKIGD